MIADEDKVDQKMYFERQLANVGTKSNEMHEDRLEDTEAMFADKRKVLAHFLTLCSLDVDLRITPLKNNSHLGNSRSH